jgi:hypothetical protein
MDLNIVATPSSADAHVEAEAGMKAPRLWKAVLLGVGLVAYIGSCIGLFWYGRHVAGTRNRNENWYAEVDNLNAEDKLRAI